MLGSARRTAARLTATVCAAALIGTLAACGGDSVTEKQETPPTAWTTEQAVNATDKKGEQQAGGDYKVIKATDPWTELKLPDGNASAMVDPKTWPDISKMLSTDQLRGIFPSRSLGIPKLCAVGTYDGVGGMTPNTTQCSWELNSGLLSSSSRMRVQLRGIGADSEVIKSWDSAREKYRGERNPADSFYVDGTYGARRVLLRDAGLGSFVISDGQIAAWFDVAFTGEDYLVQNDAAKTKDQLRTQLFPNLVQTFVTYLPRKH